ncbi:sigma-70 family RNA polymerase sigma factor [Xylocopilactobacillus apicola]|uniref:RNA polymerase sigma-70 region 2 domain-containing protein n=1 Tax=Xylocopilactobacillus apicola TaxID=2932184 RepID=A0AAU9CWU6_9LACO|nr:sigma-70 family RNA polymerase sigma factor [Xylocopilactobacillus apicola]BDR58462.1 hypothetical protein XA3_09030 [Xylocopilactobacillus apicola]
MENKTKTQIYILVKAVRDSEDNSEAFTELFELYRPLIKSFKRKFYLNDIEEDDWFQEAAIICYKACCTFTPGKGSSFSSYFKFILQHHVSTLLRQRNTNRRKANVYAVPLDGLEPSCLLSVDKKLQENRLEENIDLQDALFRVINKLPNRQLSYLISCFNGDIEQDDFTAYIKSNLKKAIIKGINFSD